ncbi:MAG: S-layer homology domain-containing protein, partial [Clostridiales bacterium]|nr:S-layer homology domain-containing protein [Clostridiales bacterium]
MKKHIFITVVAAILLIVFSAVCAFAAEEEATKAADVLYELGLFAGTGTNEDGNPIYSLERQLNRQEAMTLFIKLLGKGEEAMTGTWTTPFTDVDEWAKPFVGYAYEHGFAVGVAADRFGAHDPLTADQYMTYLLLTLGYEEGMDFLPNESALFAEEIGFNPIPFAGGVERSDAVLWNCNALVLPKKGSSDTLLGAFEGKPEDAAFIAADQGFLFTWDEDKEVVVAHYDTDLTLTDCYENDAVESGYNHDIIQKPYKLRPYDCGDGRSFGYYYGLTGLYRLHEGRLQQLSDRPVLQLIFLRYGPVSSGPVILTSNLKNPFYNEALGLFAGDTIIEIKEDGTEDVFLHGDTGHEINITNIRRNDGTVEFKGVKQLEGEHYSSYTYALFRKYVEETGKYEPSILVTKYEEGNPE